jgi:shikimate dehydrogenase
MTIKFCVVGSPIVQSLSPVLHSAAYKHLELDFSYEAHEVAPGQLFAFLENSDFQGVSVTMPLKSEAFALAFARDRQVELTGAANTLTREIDGWSASNTDIYGLTQCLKDISRPSRTTIIGAGATTNSALSALSGLFPHTHVSVMARDELALTKSVEFGLSLGLAVSASALSPKTLIDSDLVLSLVPAGSFVDTWSEVAKAQTARQGWLFDAAYNPWPTLPANSWGSERVISGLEMLMWQAIEQVALFAASAGHELELDRSALYKVMKQELSSN